MGDYTNTHSLYKPTVDAEEDWGTLMNANFDIIDAVLGTGRATNQIEIIKTGNVTLDDGNFRVVIDGDTLRVQKRESSAWVNKGGWS